MNPTSTPHHRILVTGAGGFVGGAVVDELARRGYAVAALVHRRPVREVPGVTSVTGDLLDAAALDRAMARCDAVIHLVGIIAEKPSRGITFQRIHVEGTRSVVEAAKRNGVSRLVHMSALGTRSDAPAVYHRTKAQAEELVRMSGLRWTILRPSMIHGPRGDFMRMEAAWARRAAPPYLFMPYFGAGIFGTGGAEKLQPVFVGDVARAFVDCLEKPETAGKVYALAGAQQLTWPELHRISAEAIIGRRRLVLAIPAWKALLLTRIVPRFLLPFNRDQVLMSQEDNTADMSEFATDFGWTPGAFEGQLRTYASEL